MEIDIHRRQARNLAWYDDGTEPNRNPFKKIRHRSMRSTESSTEDGLPRTQTEGDAISRPERERREEMDNTSFAPRHANTNPPTTSRQSVGDVIEMTPAGSVTSAAPLTTSKEEQPHEATEKGAPTKRRFFKSGGNHTLAGSSTQETGDSGKDKQAFTAVGQLKATLLNSWINVLLVMVPVGSRFLGIYLEFIKHDILLIPSLVAVHYAHIDPIAIFVINFIAIMYVLSFMKTARTHSLTMLYSPLAAMLSYATEDIALRYFYIPEITRTTLTLSLERGKLLVVC